MVNSPKVELMLRDYNVYLKLTTLSKHYKSFYLSSSLGLVTLLCYYK